MTIVIISIIVIGSIILIALVENEKPQIKTKDIVPIQEIQKSHKIDWKSEWQKVVPKIETVKRSQNQITKYTADQCQFYVDNTNQRFEIFEIRNNMLLNELNDIDPNQKKIDRMMKENTIAKKAIMNQIVELVTRGCINESDIDEMNKLMIIPSN